MVDNLDRKLITIFIALASAIFFFFYWPIPLGLDLQGGSRLVYRIDVEQAKAEGFVDKNADAAYILNTTQQILQERIDKLGLKDIPVVQQGSDELLIELPGMAKEEVDNTKNVLENLGSLEFLIVASAADQIDLAAEQKKLDDWLKNNPNKNIRWFNVLPEKDGGPRKGFKWYPNGQRDQAGNLEGGNYMLLRLPQEKRFEFHGTDLKRAYATADPSYGNVVAFEMKDARRVDFGDFTEANKGRQKAIILNGVVRTAPVIEDRLEGTTIIKSGQGFGFSREEVDELTKVLLTGSLAVKPQLQSEITIGATLGDDAIARAKLAGLLTMIIIPCFMMIYYGGKPFWYSSGLIASVSLLVNLVLVLGAMAFFRGTLTLPGIGGLILTAGMAVDANILIFERIREERTKGRTIKQAIASGFENAKSTIIDANLTTLIIGVILFYVGSGPIKGFAITLSIGIMTTLFATLVVSKVLFHLGMVTNIMQEIHFFKIFSNPSIPFIRMRFIGMLGSIAFIIFGVTEFFSTPDVQKYGLDFTGGALIRVQLDQPHPIGEIRQKINAVIPGASVNHLNNERVTQSQFDQGVSDEFTIKFKLSEQERQLADSVEQMEFLQNIRNALQEELLAEGISRLQIAESTDQVSSPVNFEIHLQEPAPKEAVAGVLSKVGELGEIQLSAVGETTPAKSWMVQGVVPVDAASEALRSQLITAFTQAGAQPNEPKLSNPFPEATTLGSRAVKTLRDNAARALILAFLGIIIYVRFRFHELRWGIAAVVAVIHDVLFALGAVIFINNSGLVSAEIDLTMLAAFLTIIGYSVNDTIVIFDRVRENRGKMQVDWHELLNSSINQTLSRTILTTVTTMLAVVIMFIVNYGHGNVLEGFAFSMIIGMLVGTFSTIFIASPIVLLVIALSKKNSSVTAASANTTTVSK